MTREGRPARIVELLRRAGEAHHHAFAHVNGEDPKWPVWYASYLREALGVELGVELDPERLARDLAAAEAERRERAPDAEWASYYAGWILRRHGEGEGEPGSA